MKKKDPIAEARRYVENAKTTLRENGELNVDMNRYEDDKYVRAAGNYLWLGVIKALDAVFDVRADHRTRVDVNDYKQAVGKRDRKLLAYVDDGYNVMHLSMNYDGVQSKNVSDEGFRLANLIIDRCETML
jgi:hypothetical protein